MTSKAPPIPPEQRSYKGQKKADVAGHSRDRRDETTDLQSSQPGDDDVNLKAQGRHGNIYQNTHNQGHQQDR
jgi:hypothetical protein